MKTQTTMEILGVVNRGEGKKGFWIRIGTAFRNRDDSLNLRFDYLPARGPTLHAPSPCMQCHATLDDPDVCAACAPLSVE
jgi:hypothetical protein